MHHNLIGYEKKRDSFKGDSAHFFKGESTSHN